jgi:uncharacterized protein YfkK (UPF0435 family)
MTKKATNTENVNTDYNEETNNTAAPAPEINLQDLQILKQIIDLCSSRNAFKPNEMAAVGTVYNKLDVFLTAVAEQQKVAAEGGK